MSATEHADPRRLNRVFEGNSVTEYFSGYRKAVDEALATVSRDALDRVFGVLQDAMRDNRQIYVAGNGGSAAISDHLCCDWTKGTYMPGKPSLMTRSLVSNTPVLTAFANDFSYETAISMQLEMLARKGEVLVVLSCSGNSPNVVTAVKTAKKMGLTTIGFTGFGGGELAKVCDYSVHVNFPNYGVVEDCHQILMHSLSQFLTKTLEAKR